MRPAAILLVAAVLLCGCNKDETPAVDLGLEYFPKNIGHWVEYQVDSIWYDEYTPTSGSFSYRVRETLFEEFTDPEGRPAQRIRRTVQDTSGNWYTKDIWWQTRDNYAAERTEENERRLKLTFPIGSGRNWDLNIYNTAEVREVTYKNLHQPWSSNGLSYDSTLTVKGTYYNNVVDTISINERWAKHVGMVSRDHTESKSQYDSALSTWLTRGWRVKMEAVAYGD